MVSKSICASCGAPKPDWPPFGPLMSIHDNNAIELIQFFQGELDVEKCKVCSAPLLIPSIAVSIDRHAVDLVFYGPQAKEHPEMIQTIEMDAIAGGTKIVTGFDSPDALREAVWQLLSSRAALLFRTLDSFLESSFDPLQWDEVWPRLTSSAFAAIIVAIQLGLTLDEFDLEIAERLRRHFKEQGLRVLQKLQAKVWYSVCLRWKLYAPPSGTLEEDFRIYLDTCAIVAGAPEAFFELLESLNAGTMDAATEYALEATRATLYMGVLGKANPHAARWALDYLVVEMLRSTSDDRQAKIFAALAVSEERARITIDRQALADAVRSAAASEVQNGQYRFEAIGAAVTKAGHLDLIRVVSQGLQLQMVGGESLTVEDIAQQLSNAVQECSSNPLQLEVRIDLIRQSLPPTISAEELVAITQQIESANSQNYQARAVLRYQLGHILFMRRQPEPFLNLVGAQPQSWEVNIPLTQKAVLWLWRARALRLTGNSAQATELLESLLEESELSATRIPAHVQQNILGDLALNYIDLGHIEHALKIQTALLEEPGASQHPKHITALASTYMLLGRAADAIPLFRKALYATTIEDEGFQHELEARFAFALSDVGAAEEAYDILERIPSEALKDEVVFFCWSQALINIWHHMPSEIGDRLRDAIMRTYELTKSSLAEGNILIYMTANRFLADTIDWTSVSTGEKREVWEQIDSEARIYQGSPDPKALLVLALCDWENGDFVGGRKRLLELPGSLAQRFNDARDVSVVLNSVSLKQIQAELRNLGDFVVRSDIAGSNIRLVAELQRDLIGRIAARPSQELTSGFVAPDDAEIAGICTGNRSVGVLEWVSGKQGVCCLFTRVSTEGEVLSWWIEPPSLNLAVLSQKINQRLSVWHSDRAGDPFDIENWNSLEEWLFRELGGKLPDGAQLLIIEHENIAGLQWHVAAASRWQVCYLPSWSALLNTRRFIRRTQEGPLGLAMVPKYHESPENLQILERSVSRTGALASSLGRELKSALQEACDRNTLMGVLEATIVTKVLCHGFVDPEEDVVAFMVAYDGSLPLADSVAANTPTGRRHRFDWRDCQHLKSAPAVLFSAACSSGRSHLAGVGEHLGLFSAMRHAGMRSFVAPRWDIDPEVVLPILDSAIERYLQFGVGLGEALHEACSEASKKYPRWQAWALALEGDWQ